MQIFKERILKKLNSVKNINVMKKYGDYVFLELNDGLINFSIKQIENCSVNCLEMKTNKRYHSYMKVLQVVYDQNSTISRNQLIYHLNKFGLNKSRLDELLFKEFIMNLENYTIGYILVLDDGTIFNEYY